MTGLDIGGPDTGVPGFEPIGRGEFIIPPPGLDIGNDVAGDEILFRNGTERESDALNVISCKTF